MAPVIYAGALAASCAACLVLAGGAAPAAALDVPGSSCADVAEREASRQRSNNERLTYVVCALLVSMCASAVLLVALALGAWLA